MHTTCHALVDQSAIEAAPNGTIISWVRIPGDITSEAIAFIRQQDEWTPASDPERDGETRRVTWISPGGWDPMTIDQAGIRYPAHVIRWGEVDDYQEKFNVIQTQADGQWTWPEPPAMMPLTGGTWAREKALECATQWTLSEANTLHNVGTVLAIAERFEAWLDREVTE